MDLPLSVSKRALYLEQKTQKDDKYEITGSGKRNSFTGICDMVDFSMGNLDPATPLVGLLRLFSP